MSSKLLLQLNQFIRRVEHILPSIFGRGFPPEPMCVLASPSYQLDSRNATKPFSIKDLWNDGILWAVPKTRRTLEKRQRRKFGCPDLVWKLIVPKVTLRQCVQCGHDHEVGVLCPNCYKRVMDETKTMQTAIENKLGLEPVEKEVIVLYNGEKDKPAEDWEGKRVIELEKQRPVWFSKNLLQKTTQPPATTKEVKPTDLG